MSLHFSEIFDYKGANVMHVARAGNLTTAGGILPANGVAVINVLCWVYLDNAADCVLNVATADDAAGTNTTALTENVPIWIQGVKQTAAKAVTFLSTLTADTYHSACIQVPANLVPADKYLITYLTAGNANNLVTAIAVNEDYYKG